MGQLLVQKTAPNRGPPHGSREPGAGDRPGARGGRNGAQRPRAGHPRTTGRAGTGQTIRGLTNTGQTMRGPRSADSWRSNTGARRPEAGHPGARARARARHRGQVNPGQPRSSPVQGSRPGGPPTRKPAGRVGNRQAGRSNTPGATGRRDGPARPCCRRSAQGRGRSESAFGPGRPGPSSSPSLPAGRLRGPNRPNTGQIVLVHCWSNIRGQIAVKRPK